MKTYTNEEVRKVLIDRLEREIRIQTERGNADTAYGMAYLQGYHEAICDSVWDLFDEVFRPDEWNNHINNLVKSGKIKIDKISIDKLEE